MVYFLLKRKWSSNVLLFYFQNTFWNSFPFVHTSTFGTTRIVIKHPVYTFAVWFLTFHSFTGHRAHRTAAIMWVYLQIWATVRPTTSAGMAVVGTVSKTLTEVTGVTGICKPSWSRLRMMYVIVVFSVKPHNKDCWPNQKKRKLYFNERHGYMYLNMITFSLTVIRSVYVSAPT